MERKKLPKFVKYGRTPSVVSPTSLGPDFFRRDLEVFEKADGGNCQVRRIEEWNLVAGNRANYLKGEVIGRHPWFSDFIGWMYSNNTLYNLPMNFIMFGEWTSLHTIRYSEENTDKFFVLDLYALKTGRLMEYGKARELLEKCKVEDVRFLDVKVKGRLNIALLEKMLNEPSDLYKGEKEGLVVKDYDFNPQFRLKLYHPLHSEKTHLNNGTFDCLTPSRFIKAIYRVMEQKRGDKSKFNDVIEEVIRDVVVEEGTFYNFSSVRIRLSSYIKENKLGHASKFLI